MAKRIVLFVLIISMVVLPINSKLQDLQSNLRGKSSWRLEQKLKSPRAWDAVVNCNDTIYALGGYWELHDTYINSVDAYSMSKPYWENVSNLPAVRMNFQAIALNNTIYLIGGYDIYGGYFSSVDAFDTITRNWSKVASFPKNVSGLGATTLNGKIYVAGGEYCNDHNCTTFNSLYEYDPSTNEWTSKAGMIEARDTFQLATVNNKIYAFGGARINENGYISEILKSVEEYDPISDSWTMKADMIFPSMAFAVGVLSEKIYLFGGMINASAVQEYDYNTNSWTLKEDMKTPRWAFQATTYNNRIYTVGGIASITNSTTGVVESFDPRD